MKTLVSITTSLLMVASASAVYLDINGFGASLNGWRKGRFACYEFVDGHYRTHVPTVTRLTSGGMFVSTRIDQGAGSTNIVHLELTFSADGRLMIGQVKGTIAGKKVDSGLVTRAEDIEVTGDGAPQLPVDPLSPADRLAADMFAALDADIVKNAEGEEERVDLVGRLFGSKNKANLAGAARHNYNLILQEIE